MLRIQRDYQPQNVIGKPTLFWFVESCLIFHALLVFQCVFTMLGSILGFSFGVMGTMDIAYYIQNPNSSRCRYYYSGDYYYYYLYVKDTCTQMISLMAIETLFCFGRCSTRLLK